MTNLRRRVGVLILLGLLLLVGLSLVKPAIGQVSTLAATQTVMATRQPTVTPTPNATAQWENQLAEAHLQMNPRATCPGKDFYRGCYLLRQLDYLYQNPYSPYREQVIERTAEVIGYDARVQYNWLVDDWLDRQVAQAFQAANGMPVGFEEQWKGRLQFIETDLDNTHEPDYLVKASFRTDILGWDPFFTGLYWLGRVGGRYAIEPLEEGQFLDLDVIFHRDLNGDGRRDLAYTSGSSVSNSDAKEIHLLTRQSGRWQNLPIRTEFGSGLYGDWSIETQPDDGVEVIQLQRGSHFDLAYHVHYRWANNQFVPVRISLADDYSRLKEPAAFEWVNHLLEAHQFGDALQVLGFMTSNKDLAPYALFRQGMVYLYQRDVTTAQYSWRRLQDEYPDHPVTQSVTTLRRMVEKPEAVWQVCAWLKRNVDEWLPPGMTAENARNLPIVNRLFWSPYRLCRTDLLIKIARWSRSQPLAQQAAQAGLPFRMLSTDFDLDGDRQPDPIAAMGGSIWAFLPDGDRWRPVLASRGLYPWRSPYGQHPIPNTGIQVTDLDANGRPEILLWDASDTLLAEWTGKRFESQRLPHSGSTAQLSLKPMGGRQQAIQLMLFDYDKPEIRTGEETYRLNNGVVTRISPPPDPPPPATILSRAIEALYRNRDPHQALTLLKGFTSDDPWEAGLARYLEALTWEYMGDSVKAQAAYRAVIQDYAGTGWSVLAQEKIQ